VTNSFQSPTNPNRRYMWHVQKNKVEWTWGSSWAV
jgi:hypothetical protein